LAIKIKMAEHSGDRMQKLDLTKDSHLLKDIELQYIKKFEERNRERVKTLRKLRQRNLMTGFLVATGVFSIYAYSMYAVKQEKFLDDFDEPGQEENK